MVEQNNKNRNSTVRPASVDDNRNGTGMGRTAMIAAIVLAAVLALGMWSFSGDNNTTSTQSQGTTTGMSTTSPQSAPSAPATTTPSTPNGNNTK
jgi:hypothetical protein